MIPIVLGVIYILRAETTSNLGSCMLPSEIFKVIYATGMIPLFVLNDQFVHCTLSFINIPESPCLCIPRTQTCHSSYLNVIANYMHCQVYVGTFYQQACLRGVTVNKMYRCRKRNWDIYNQDFNLGLPTLVGCSYHWATAWSIGIQGTEIYRHDSIVVGSFSGLGFRLCIGSPCIYSVGYGTKVLMLSPA